MTICMTMGFSLIVRSAVATSHDAITTWSTARSFVTESEAPIDRSTPSNQAAHLSTARTAKATAVYDTTAAYFIYFYITCR